MLSYKAGLRAKEIANLNWLMVCDSEGQLSQEINLINKASKGKQSGRIIPLHKDLAILLAELLVEQKKNEHFVLTNRIITTERTNKTSPQAIVNFFYIRKSALKVAPHIAAVEHSSPPLRKISALPAEP